MEKTTQLKITETAWNLLKDNKLLGETYSDTIIRLLLKVKLGKKNG